MLFRSNVTFSTPVSNGAAAQAYQWKVNGASVSGATNAVYSYPPAQGDLVTCSLTSSEVCTLQNPVTSIPVGMTVNPLLLVNVSVSASANPVCAGTGVIFTATPSSGGILPQYQWLVNGSPVPGAVNQVYVRTPVNGDVITCRLTSSETCTLANPVTGIPVTMTVNSLMPVSVTVAASANPYCASSSVTFTATPVNGGISPAFNWFVNGMAAGTGLPVYTAVPTTGETVHCVVTSSETCATGNPATSPPITMSEHPVPVITLIPCFDTLTTSGAQPYRLRGGLPGGGTFSGPGVTPSTGIFSPATAGTGLKIITYSYSNIYSCMASATRSIRVVPVSSFICGSSLTDIRDGKTYGTVQIASQCWMSENLRFGTEIPAAIPQTDNCTGERYVQGAGPVVNNTFYQWDEVMNYTTSPGGQGLCPPGWHIPTLTEWGTLMGNFFGPGMSGSWLKDFYLANGFDSHQIGLFYQNNTWAYGSGNYSGAMYWTSEAAGSDRASARGINTFNLSVSWYNARRSDAFNVRCLKD